MTTQDTTGETGSDGGSQGVNQDGNMDNTIIIVVIAVAVSALVVIIILICIVIVIVVILRHRNHSKDFAVTATHRKDSLDYTGEPFYQEVSKPPPPPLPERFPDLNPDIEAYAVVSTTGGGVGQNGGMEMTGNNHWAPQQVPLVVTTDMNSSTLAPPDHHSFLEKNPLYASSDNIDEEKPRVHQRRAGSIPSLDVLTDSPHGSQLNIYAQPSHVAPPIPKRPPTPELMDEPIYSTSEKNINPSVFKSRMPSPPEEELLPCVSIYADPQPLLRSEGPLDITPDNIKEVRNLGVGQFGQVVLAETVGLSRRDLGLVCEDEEGTEEEGVVHVAVKRLKESAESHVKEAFEKEIKFMSRLRHGNVVRLLGICSTGNPFIIMEYMENGDLNQFLRKHKPLTADATPSKRRLSPKQLTYICMGIASGMKYLATFKFIHRDLATRNCLVGSNLKIKIADFGMSRSLYSSYYYRISGRAMLPIRWMANECFYGKFSEKTDVWAFGVTMWEVFMFAKEQPYQGMTDQEVIDDAIKGPDRLLLAKPEYCPPEVYQVMKQCWIDDPDERSRFRDAHSLLEAIHDFAGL